MAVENELVFVSKSRVRIIFMETIADEIFMIVCRFLDILSRSILIELHYYY